MRVTCGPDPEISGVLLAKPVGHLDVHGATHLWEALSPRLNDQTPSLLIDMGGIDWMTSAGIGTLIRLVSHVEELGGKLAVFGCNEKVREVLRITALETMLNTSETAGAAREQLR
jgi:anti-anti-sigma factor